MISEGRWIESAYATVKHYVLDDQSCYIAICGRQITIGHQTMRHAKPACRDCVKRLTR